VNWEERRASLKIWSRNDFTNGYFASKVTAGGEKIGDKWGIQCSPNFLEITGLIVNKAVYFARHLLKWKENADEKNSPRFHDICGDYHRRIRPSEK
jgi:hypothetical protein